MKNTSKSNQKHDQSCYSFTYPKTGDKYLQFLLTESSVFLKSGKQNIPDGIGVYLYPKNIFVTTILDPNLVSSLDYQQELSAIFVIVLGANPTIPPVMSILVPFINSQSQSTPQSKSIINSDCHTFPGHILKTLVTNKLIREYLEMSKSAGTVNKVVKHVCREFI